VTDRNVSRSRSVSTQAGDV
jgi:putative transposase